MALAECRVGQAADMQTGVDRIVRFDVQHVLYGAALRVLRAFRNFVHLEPVAATLGREEQHGVVHCGVVDVFDEVRIARAGTLRADAVLLLCAEFGQLRAFDVAQVRDGDHHLVVGIEVLGVEFGGGEADFRAAFVAVFLFHFQQFVLDDLTADGIVGEHLFEPCNASFDFLVFLMQLFLLYVRQLCQSHIHDGLGLQVVQSEALHQRLHGRLWVS